MLKRITEHMAAALVDDPALVKRLEDWMHTGEQIGAELVARMEQRVKRDGPAVTQAEAAEQAFVTGLARACVAPARAISTELFNYAFTLAVLQSPLGVKPSGLIVARNSRITGSD